MYLFIHLLLLTPVKGQDWLEPVQLLSTVATKIVKPFMGVLMMQLDHLKSVPKDEVLVRTLAFALEDLTLKEPLLKEESWRILVLPSFSLGLDSQS